MKKLTYAMAGLATAAVLGGCYSLPCGFERSSVPVPPQGYAVIGSEVTGTCSQIWVLGIGGSTEPQQARAYREALSKAQNADALVAMSIESHEVNLFPIFVSREISVTGTPVKFNK